MLVLVSIIFTIISAGIILYLAKYIPSYLIYRSRAVAPLFDTKSIKLLDPTKCGLPDGKHYWLRTSAGKIGCWFLAGHNPIISVLYLHGQKYDRSSFERVYFMRILCELGCNVLSVDYRGYGDSDGYPDDLGLVEDSEAAYIKLCELTPSVPIVVWGHSMGSGVATALTMNLSEVQKGPAGLILEAPICSIYEVYKCHQHSCIISKVPGFGTYVHDTMKSSFNNLNKIEGIRCPILLIHSKDDPKISEENSIKIFNQFKKANPDSDSIEYVECHSSYLHSFVSASPIVHEILRKFFRKVIPYFQDS